MKTPGLELAEVFSRARARADERAKGSQWVSIQNGTVSAFYFRPPLGWVEPPPLDIARPGVFPREKSKIEVSPEKAREAAKMASEASRPMSEKRYREASDLLEKAVGLNPALWEAFQLLGRARFKQGELASASEAFTRALAVKTDLAELYIDRATCLSELSNYAGAISDLNTAIGLDPDSWQAYWIRSQARANLGDRNGSKVDDTKSKELKVKQRAQTPN